jgi:hypothetical protein
MSEGRMAGVMHAIRLAGGLKGLGLEKAHFGVLMVMAFFEDDETGDCWPSCRTIGAWSGQNKSRTSTRRTELETMGYIIEDRPKRVERGTAFRKYWKFNEEIFPKVQGSKRVMGRRVSLHLHMNLWALLRFQLRQCPKPRPVRRKSCPQLRSIWAWLRRR